MGSVVKTGGSHGVEKLADYGTALNPAGKIYSGTDKGIYHGDSQQHREFVDSTKANKLRFAQGSNNKISQKMLASFDTSVKIAGGHGATVLGQAGTLSGAAWVVGNLAGGNATRGKITFDAIADQILIGIDLPDLVVDSGVAADVVLNLRLDPTNATDRFDYAVYKHDGTELVAAVDQTIGNAAEADYAINLGALTWNKGDSLIIFIGNFETSGASATTADLYWIELKYLAGIELDSA